MNRPYSGKGLDKVIAAINAESGGKYTYGTDYVVDGVTPLKGDAKHNSQVAVYPLRNGRRLNPQYIPYNRLQLSILKNLPDGYVKAVVIDRVPFSVHDILDRIAAATGLDLVPGDLVNDTFTSLQPSYQIRADETQSYRWIGSIPLSFRLSTAPQNIGEVILQRNLSGLVYTPPANGS